MQTRFLTIEKLLKISRYAGIETEGLACERMIKRQCLCVQTQPTYRIAARAETFVAGDGCADCGQLHPHLAVVVGNRRQCHLCKTTVGFQHFEMRCCFAAAIVVRCRNGLVSQSVVCQPMYQSAILLCWLAFDHRNECLLHSTFVPIAVQTFESLVGFGKQQQA